MPVMPKFISVLFWCLVVLGAACLQGVEAQTWSATGSLEHPSGVLYSMSIARSLHTATLLNNGKVLVAGGDDGTGNGALRSCELYDPATGAWSNTGNLNAGRYFHTATLLNDGRVLVVGGTSGINDFYPGNGEIYDPSTGAWTYTSSMTTARTNHTATLLNNGKVLIAGGSIVSFGNTSPTASCELFDPATGNWSTTNNLATARSLHTATLLSNSKVLVAGGLGSSTLATCQLYDPSTGTWSNTANLATARHTHTATLLNNGKVLVTAGRNPSAMSTCELYDPAAGTWSNTGSLAAARYNHTTTLLSNGKVLVTGGRSGLTKLNTCEVYDPSAGTWSATANLNTARYSQTATLLNTGKVLVAGGRGNAGTLNVCDLYDAVTGTFAESAPSPERYEHTATLLGNGKVLVAGGTDYNNVLIQQNCQLYDAGSGTWSNTGSMAAARFGHTATLLSNGKVLVGAGANSVFASGNLSSCELYDPATGTWSTTGSLTTARRYSAAVRLNDGKVLAIGGLGASGSSALTSCELYDPATGTWSTTGSMTTARYRPTAILLNNGKVLVVGAYDGSSFLTSCELYDPATGTWSTTGSTITARLGAPATLLSNGKVLAAGGTPNNTSALNTCELYDPAAGTWSATGSMSTARYFHTATLLDSKVLVTGGTSNGTTSFSNCELYDVSTGTWSATASMSIPRQGHTGTLLNNGRVLVACGYTGSNVVSSAELFNPNPNTAPTVVTVAADSITATGAKIYATINPGGAATTAKFQYGTDTSYGTDISIILTPSNGSTDQAVSATLTGLAPGTTYHFRATATNSIATTDGADLTFTTLQASSLIQIGDVTVTEGDSGTTSATFTVSLSSASTQTITVSYGAIAGTTNPATVGSDLLSTKGTLTFAPGDTTKTITVPVVGDYVSEADETFIVKLSSPINAIISDGQGLGTITNDDFDTTPPTVSFTTSTTTPTGTTPQTGGTVYNVVPGITGVAADAGSGIARVQLRLYRLTATAGVYEYWNGTGWVIPSGTVAIPLLSTTLSGAAGSANVSWSRSTAWPTGSNFADGTYYLTAYAYDRAGKFASSSRNFKKLTDSTAPSVSFTTSATTPTGTTPVSGSTVSNTMPTITGIAADSASGVAKVELRLYRPTATAGVYENWTGSTWTGTLAALSTVMNPAAGGASISWSRSSGWPGGGDFADGTYYLRATAYDKAGNLTATAASNFKKVTSAGLFLQLFENDEPSQ